MTQRNERAPLRRRDVARESIQRAAIAAAVVASLLLAANAGAQGFPNIARTEGELLAGPIAPEQGRTAIIAWHGDRIVTVPEAPGSQPGADVLMRVVNIQDPANPQVTLLPAHTSGFHAHGYFHYGDYLYVGPHCLTADLQPCDTGPSVWANSLRIGGPGMAIGDSQLRRADIESAGGLPVGGVNKSGAQSPWAAEDFWTYNVISGSAFLGVRRSLGSYIYDWANGGTPNGPSVTATWDHLGETGVIGFPFIMGNILIYAADMTGTGVAAYDISDLENPVLLDVLKEENPGGYWPEVYGHYVFFPRRDGEGGAGSSAGFMVVDFEDPTDLRVVADRNLPGSNQYVTFQDEYAFMNRYKIDMRTFDVALELETVPGVIDASQFALPVGNLLVTGGYGTDGPGLAIWAHQAAPDTRSPFVAYHVPRPDQTNYSIHCPITFSIPETLRTQTIVDGASLIVQPVGGSPVQTWHSFGQGKLLTVTPRQPLLPDTTYEVILTSAIQDAAGNGLEPYSFRFSTGNGLAGGNQPPSIGAISVAPETVAPGGNALLSWSGSDPDGGAIDYRVDFGDGSPRTDWAAATTANHAYAEAGHYQVTVQARDAQGGVSARSRSITVVSAPTAPNSTASALLAVDASNGRLYVANTDVDTVSALDLATMGLLWETPVGAHPVGVAMANDGTVWVASRDGDSIDVLNGANGASLDSLPVGYGRAPVAIAPSPDGSLLYATCEGDGTLRRFSAASRTQTGSVALGPTPRAIAITEDGTRAIVTRFLSPEYVGEVYDVSLTGGMALTRTIELIRDRSADGSASSRGVPNYLASVRIDPNGDRAWVVGKKDNVTRGVFFGPMMTPGQDNTVRAQMMAVDLATNAEDRTLRLDVDNSDSPSAIVFSPLGDYAFVALQGNALVASLDMLDFLRQDSPGSVHSRWEAGQAPQGLAIDSATGRLFASSLTERSVSTLDVSAYLTDGSPNVPTTAVGSIQTERFHPDTLRGKQLFYHASDPRMSAEGYISCATCHIDGSHDGRTFDFTNRGEGFRNTTDLRGRGGTFHGAVHWSANFDEIQDFENDIRMFFGGTGFLSDSDFAATQNTLGAPKAGLNGDLDALAAYVSSLGHDSIPRSPYRQTDGSLTAAAIRGEQLFFSQGCNSCHRAELDYTDLATRDVGTLSALSGNRLGGPLTGIDTPTLLGVHATAPYLHNGKAATLRDVFHTTGGRLAQFEDGVMGNGAAPEDISWWPMKEWHNSQFVELNGSETVTFNDVASASAGAGYLDIRFRSAYGNSTLQITVNGSTQNATLPRSPSEPGVDWMPIEWRSVRVPVTYQAGMNTFAFREGPTGAQLLMDDVLFSTPGDAALAGAHVRNLSAGDEDDLIAYLLSLDGTEARKPDAAVLRGAPIVLGGVDNVAAQPEDVELSIVYAIENNGASPLNLGRVVLETNPGGAFSVVRNPPARILPGQTGEMELHVVLTGGAVAADLAIASDDPTHAPLAWSVAVTGGGPTAAGDMWVAY